MPSPPLGPLGFYGVTDDSVTITWHPSEKNGGSAVIDYTVEIKQEGRKWRHAATSTTTSAKIERLTANVTYSFRIYARNEIGTSLPYESDEKITAGKTLCKLINTFTFICTEEMPTYLNFTIDTLRYFSDFAHFLDELPKVCNKMFDE